MPDPDRDTFDPKRAIYTPSQVSTYGIQSVQEIQHSMTGGVGIPIAEIDTYFAPVLPGEVCVILAQTHHYKSEFLRFIEANLAKKLTDDQLNDHIIVHVSLEETIEEQAFHELARLSGMLTGDLATGNVQDWDKLNQAATIVGTIPIYRIGSSLARAEDAPNLYLSNMQRAIAYLANDLLDWKPKIAALFFDYLQAFPFDPEVRREKMIDQRRLQVRSDMYRLFDIARMMRCPVFVAVQAKQELQGAHPPIMLPGMYDAEETSSIAQRADRIISLWMPKNTNLVGEDIHWKGGGNFTVSEDMLWIKVVKQRGGLPSGRFWATRVDFRTGRIVPWKWAVNPF